MRTLTTQMVVAVLILAAGAAFAEPRGEPDGNIQDTFRAPNQLRGSPGHSLLKLSPMFLEIHAVIEEANKTEADLLAQLAVTEDNDTAVRLIQRLQRLDADRKIDVLRVELRYAQLAGNYSKIFRLRQDLLELMRENTVALM